MSSSLKIRPMVLSDIDSVMILEEVSFPDPWHRSLYERELKSNRFSRYHVIVPQHEDASQPVVLAYGGYWLTGPEAHIVTIAVDPEWRGRSLGKWLLLALIKEAREGGATMVTLEVRPSNQAALALYRQVGFISVGQRKRYYPNGEDALLLELADLDDPVSWEPLEQEVERLVRLLGSGENAA
jgi:[ribosomal protein S18]-alanine N-acetyltransferase